MWAGYLLSCRGQGSNRSLSYVIGWKGTAVSDARCPVICPVDEYNLVELGFGGWGDPPRPDTPDDFEDYFATLKTDQPLPSWFMALVDELIKYKDTATIETPQSRTFSTRISSYMNSNRAYH